MLYNNNNNNNTANNTTTATNNDDNNNNKTTNNINNHDDDAVPADDNHVNVVCTLDKSFYYPYLSVPSDSCNYSEKKSSRSSIPQDNPSRGYYNNGQTFQTR